MNESPAAVAVAAVIAVIAGGAALLLVMQGALVLELGLVALEEQLAQREIALPALGVVVALAAAATLVLVLARALGLPAEGLAAGALASILRLARPHAPLLVPVVALERQCRPRR